MDFRRYGIRSFVIDLFVIVAFSLLLFSLKHGSALSSALSTSSHGYLDAPSTGRMSFLMPEAGRHGYIQPIETVLLPVRMVQSELLLQPHILNKIANNNNN